MSKASSPRPSAEASAVKPEVLRLALDVPLEAANPVTRQSAARAPLSPRARTQLKFVQIGIWAARRRCLAGQTEDLGVLLAHLDEDIELLRRALEDGGGREAPAGKRKRKR